MNRLIARLPIRPSHETPDQLAPRKDRRRADGPMADRRGNMAVGAVHYPITGNGDGPVRWQSLPQPQNSNPSDSGRKGRQQNKLDNDLSIRSDSAVNLQPVSSPISGCVFGR